MFASKDRDYQRPGSPRRHGHREHLSSSLVHKHKMQSGIPNAVFYDELIVLPVRTTLIKPHEPVEEPKTHKNGGGSLGHILDRYSSNLSGIDGDPAYKGLVGALLPEKGKRGEMEKNRTQKDPHEDAMEQAGEDTEGNKIDEREEKHKNASFVTNPYSIHELFSHMRFRDAFLRPLALRPQKKQLLYSGAELGVLLNCKKEWLIGTNLPGIVLLTCAYMIMHDSCHLSGRISEMSSHTDMTSQLAQPESQREDTRASNQKRPASARDGSHAYQPIPFLYEGQTKSQGSRASSARGGQRSQTSTTDRAGRAFGSAGSGRGQSSTANRGSSSARGPGSTRVQNYVGQSGRPSAAEASHREVDPSDMAEGEVQYTVPGYPGPDTNHACSSAAFHENILDLEHEQQRLVSAKSSPATDRPSWNASVQVDYEPVHELHLHNTESRNRSSTAEFLRAGHGPISLQSARVSRAEVTRHLERYYDTIRGLKTAHIEAAQQLHMSTGLNAFQEGRQALIPSVVEGRHAMPNADENSSNTPGTSRAGKVQSIIEKYDRDGNFPSGHDRTSDVYRKAIENLTAEEAWIQDHMREHGMISHFEYGPAGYDPRKYEAKTQDNYGPRVFGIAVFSANEEGIAFDVLAEVLGYKRELINFEHCHVESFVDLERIATLMSLVKKKGYDVETICVRIGELLVPQWGNSLLCVGTKSRFAPMPTVGSFGILYDNGADDKPHRQLQEAGAQLLKSLPHLTNSPHEFGIPANVSLNLKNPIIPFEAQEVQTLQDLEDMEDVEARGLNWDSFSFVGAELAKQRPLLELKLELLKGFCGKESLANFVPIWVRYAGIVHQQEFQSKHLHMRLEELENRRRTPTPWRLAEREKQLKQKDEQMRDMQEEINRLKRTIHSLQKGHTQGLQWMELKEQNRRLEKEATATLRDLATVAENFKDLQSETDDLRRWKIDAEKKLLKQDHEIFRLERYIERQADSHAHNMFRERNKAKLNTYAFSPQKSARVK